MLLLRKAEPGEGRSLMAWIAERHYLKCCPPGYIAALEFLAGQERVGAMLLGRPTSRELDPRQVLELTRMYFVDHAPRNTESRALAMMRAWVRKWMPHVRLLLAYSDPAQGHTGTVYAADGWAPFGRTKHARGCGWRSRAGRRDQPVTPKQRWVRTP